MPAYDEHQADNRAARREKLTRRIDKLAAYTRDNSHAAEYANAQARIATTKAQIAALEPNQLALLCELRDVLTSITTELNRFFVLRDDTAHKIALWIVHTHVFQHQIVDESGAVRHIFDHTPRLIVWSQTHGSGKTTLAEIIAGLVANPEAISSLTGVELQAFLRRAAEKRNGRASRPIDELDGLLGSGLYTYIFDEAEQYKNTGLLLRLINGGHRHDGQIWDAKGRRVSIFAPLALFRRFDPRSTPSSGRLYPARSWLR
jgi:hypothetical protein